MTVTDYAEKCMIFNLFRFCFQHNFDTQYRLDEHSKGSIAYYNKRPCGR